MTTMTREQFENFAQEMKIRLSKYVTQDTITYQKNHRISFHDYDLKDYTIDSVEIFDRGTFFTLFIYVNQNKNVFSRLLKKITNEMDISCDFVSYNVYDINVKKYFGMLSFHVYKKI